MKFRPAHYRLRQRQRPGKSSALRTHSTSIVEVIVSACDGGITFDEIEDRAKLCDSCDSSSICAETYYFGGFFLWIVGQYMFRLRH